MYVAVVPEFNVNVPLPLFVSANAPAICPVVLNVEAKTETLISLAAARVITPVPQFHAFPTVQSNVTAPVIETAFTLAFVRAATVLPKVAPAGSTIDAVPKAVVEPMRIVPVDEQVIVPVSVFTPDKVSAVAPTSVMLPPVPETAPVNTVVVPPEMVSVAAPSTRPPPVAPPPASDLIVWLKPVMSRETPAVLAVVTSTLELSAETLPHAMPPALIASGPANVFAPDRVVMPAPLLVMPNAPEMIPDSVEAGADTKAKAALKEMGQEIVGVPVEETVSVGVPLANASVSAPASV